ncbi:copper chaperone PCu(A)C [Thauera sp. JM12B12]|uniref:copper chaperone PCu(A)C n=1 Tax=Thauera sp. JM12B12 TaxID=3142262 RepID=UPI0031F337A2
MHKPTFATSLLAALVLLGSAAAHAEVTVAEPWVRATVPAQKATGAFMQLESDADARLVSAASPVAGVVEIHEMVMDKDVMKMNRVDGLALPAGQAVELKPGGYHVMLMDLKDQVKEGDQVPLTLIVENKDGSRQTIELTAPARPLNAPMKMQHGKH